MVASELGQPIWTRDFISVSLTQLLVFSVFYALVAVLPLYVIDVLHGSAGDAGLVVTLMVVAQILIRLASEPVLSLSGRKRGLVVAVIAFAITAVVYIWVDALGSMYLLRFVHGLSFGIVSTATAAIAANIVPSDRRGEGIGYFAMATTSAVVIGPFAGLMLLQVISFTALFVILAVVSFAAVMTALAVFVPEERFAGPRQWRSLSINDFIEPKAVPISAVAGLVTFAYAGVTAFVPVFAAGLGLSQAAAYFFLVYAGGLLVSRPYFGRRFDRRGATGVVVAGLLLFASGFAVLAVTTNWLYLVAAALLVGLGFGALQPSFQTMAVQMTSHSRAGHATVTFFTFFDLGVALGSVSLGLIVDGFGFRVLYGSTAVMALFMIGLFVLVLKRTGAPPPVARARSLEPEG